MPKYKRYFYNNSIVFITIVTNQRKNILIENIELLRKSIKLTKHNFSIIAGVILPEHIHILIQPEKIEEILKMAA